MTIQVNGTLRNARRVLPGEDPRAPCLSGDVYGDTKGRFRDGERITTSTIFEELPDGVFKTRYSAYRVESWAGGAPANDNAVSAYTDLRSANRVRQTEWDTGGQIAGPLGKLWRANELAGEAGEASNVVKKLVREELGIKGSRATVEHLGEELADIVICTDLLAQEYGIDLDAAVRRKFNATSEANGLLTRLVSA